MSQTILFKILLLLTLTVSLNAFAQKKSSDSYQEFKSRSQQENIDQLLTDAHTLKNSKPAEALNKVKQALGMSLAQQDIYGEGKCYVLLGEINEGIEEWKLAFENFLQASQKLASAYQHTKEYQESLRGLGNTSLKQNNYQQALQYFQEGLSLKLSEAERYERQLDISEVYYQMGNYNEALSVLTNKEIKYSRKKIVDQNLSLKIQNQKAKIYARMNKIDAAQELYEDNFHKDKPTALQHGASKQEEQSIQSAKEEISEKLVENELYDDEINLRNKSIAYNKENKNFEEVSKDKQELSKALVAKGETSEAIRELEEAASIADTINNPKEQAKAFLALADLYERNGLNEKAISTYKKYSQAVGKAEEQNKTHLLQKSELIKTQRDIEELSKDVSIGQRDETIERGTVFRQQLIIYGLLAIILIIFITSYFIYKNAQASKIANHLLALKSLRSQMNPHFIFNALNSVNHFIAQQDERAANKFLSEFSQLMRLVLENSQEDFIPFYKEQEILSLYLKLEHYRFRDKFDYEINMDENINTESIMIPPMLIQPYIENAVWHGLRYKETKGKLVLRIVQNTNHLLIKITDDGIGRRNSALLKTENQKKHQSTGLKNIEERLAIINKVYRSHYKVVVEDGDDVTHEGTSVSILVPINK